MPAKGSRVCIWVPAVRAFPSVPVFSARITARRVCASPLSITLSVRAYRVSPSAVSSVPLFRSWGFPVALAVISISASAASASIRRHPRFSPYRSRYSPVAYRSVAIRSAWSTPANAWVITA